MTWTEFVLSLIAGFLVSEFTDLAPRLARWAARHHYTNPDRAATRAEEYQAVLADRPAKLFKLITATGFAAAATAALVARRVQRLPTIPRRIRQRLQQPPIFDSNLGRGNYIFMGIGSLLISAGQIYFSIRFLTADGGAYTSNHGIQRVFTGSTSVEIGDITMSATEHTFYNIFYGTLFGLGVIPAIINGVGNLRKAAWANKKRDSLVGQDKP